MNCGPVTGGLFLLPFVLLGSGSEGWNGGRPQSHDGGHVFAVRRWWKSKLTPFFYENLLTLTLMMLQSGEVWKAFRCLIMGCLSLSVSLCKLLYYTHKRRLHNIILQFVCKCHIIANPLLILHILQ